MKTKIQNVKKVVILLTLVFGLSIIVNAQTKTAVKVADLQKGITADIAKNYAGYAIKDAYKVVKNKVTTYDVDVVKDNKNVCLSYDNSGKFLKVIEPKVSKTSGNKTNTKTSTKTTPKTNEKSTSSVIIKTRPLGKRAIIG